MVYVICHKDWGGSEALTMTRTRRGTTFGAHAGGMPTHLQEIGHVWHHRL